MLNIPMTTKQKETLKELIREWMISRRRNHIDEHTGECDSISLAEETAKELDLYEDKETYRIPQEVFELSLDVSLSIRA